MSRSAAQIYAQEEMARDCCRLVARIALEASETLPTAQRIMIHKGIAAIFPKGSPERRQAHRAARALATAERRQLRLTSLLTDA